jgi:hypothetical protein
MALPFTILTVPGTEAPARLDALVREGEQAGFTPLVLGGRDETRFLEEAESLNDEPIEAAIQRFEKRQDDHQEVFTRLRGELEEDGIEFDGEDGEEADFSQPHPGLTAYLDLRSQKPLPEVILAKIPTRPEWLAPIYLRFGAWNACPEPVDHAILHKYWAGKYGASLRCITHDVVECFVGRPPQTMDDALELAREQYIYCSDIVDQGCESVKALAASLLRSNYWYFWWD